MTESITTRSLLDAVTDAVPADGVALGDLLATFQHRAMGLGVLIASLPLFVPLPVGTGAVSGPLVMLLGLQLLLQRVYPWLPGFIARHRIPRPRVERMGERLAPILGRIERFCHPRLDKLFDRGLANAVTGLLLMLVGLLAALPIPFTNYPFGVLLVLFAVALIERDGALMLAAWLLALATVIATALLSTELVAIGARLLGAA